MLKKLISFLKPRTAAVEPVATVAGAGRPQIVCLCGSTRFWRELAEANLRETVAGRIVLAPGCDMKSPHSLWADERDAEELKARLDELHRAKVRMADEVLVVNPGGYVGQSTSSEIAYALSLGLPVRYTDPTGTVAGPPESTRTPVAGSRSTEPRVLASYELADWLCPHCEEPAVEGTHAWDDRGPHQLLSVHVLRCAAGHSWSDHNDGG